MNIRRTATWPLRTAMWALFAASSGVLFAGSASAQDVAKPARAQEKAQELPQLNVQRAKPVVQDLGRDFRFRHRLRVSEKRAAVAVGKPFTKVLHIDAVDDGIARVRLPKVANRGTPQVPQFGYYHLGPKVSARRLKRLVGQEVELKLQSDRNGHLIVLEFDVPRAR